MSLELINPETLHAPTTYSHLAVARGTSLVFVAGQVGLATDGTLVGEGDAAAQAAQAYRNLATALAAAGASIAEVAKLTTYVVDHRPELIEPIREARAEVFGDHAPASTFIGVATLIRPELLVEVEAVAILD